MKERCFSLVKRPRLGAQIPQEYEHGARMNAAVTLNDSHGRGLLAETTVHVERNAEIVRKPDARNTSRFQAAQKNNPLMETD